MTTKSLKKKHIRLLLIVISLYFFSFSKAQNRYYENGYIVTNSGDTINGFIKRVRYNVLCNGINFKINLEDNTTSIRFNPDSLQSFCFTKDKTIFDQVVYKATYNNKPVTKKLFGQLLVSGKLKLYRLNMLDDHNSTVFDTDNDHIYIVKKDTTYSVLRMNEKIIGTKYYLKKDYIITLGNIMNDCDSLINRINSLSFIDKEMKSIVYDYNNITSNTPNIVYNIKSTFKIKHGISASYHLFNVDPKGLSNKAYSFGYFWDILDPDINEHVSLMTGINYFNLTDENSKYNYLNIPLLSTINLSNKKIAPFINFGITMSVPDFYHFSDITLMYNIGVGTYINNKFFLSVNTENSISLVNIIKYYWLNFKVGVRL